MEEETKNNLPQKIKQPVSEKRLDELAWLLEGTSFCAAVMIINGTFYVACNDFFENTTSNNNQSDFISKVLTYFQNFANNPNIKEEYLEPHRNALMVKICKTMISMASLGRIIIPDSIFEKMLTSQVLLSQKLPDDSDLLKKKKTEGFMVLAYGILVFERIRKIESFVKDCSAGNWRDEQASAQKIADAKILKHELESGVHAEVQLLSQIIMFIEGKILLEKQEIYFGISKYSCIDCNCLLSEANKILSSAGIQIKYAGSHKGRYDNWILPRIFQSGFNETLAKTRRASQKLKEKPSALSFKDQIGYSFKNAQKQLIPEKKYEMRGSRSSSEFSKTGEEKFNDFKQKLENDMLVFQKYNIPLPEELELGMNLCKSMTFKYLFDEENTEIEEMLENSTSLVVEELLTENIEVGSKSVFNFCKKTFLNK